MTISQEILKRILSVQDLPTLPAVMHKILETVTDEKASSQDLTRVLEMDHSISTRVLRMANSPFYGIPSQVDTIRRAVVLLGFDAVKMLALATTVFDAFAGKKQFAFDPEDFWMHALGTAKAAQIVAQRTGVQADPDTCFTAGLVHDIGKFILALGLRQDYISVVENAESTKRPLHEVEKSILGTTHADVGAWMAEKWRFPMVIRESIGQLYDPAPTSEEAKTVALANHLSRLADFGLAGDPSPPKSAPEVAQNPLGLDGRGIEETIAALCAIKAETRELLSMLGGAGA